jgi:hypothetical protein
MEDENGFDLIKGSRRVKERYTGVGEKNGDGPGGSSYRVHPKATAVTRR